jgi:cytochrome c556
MSGCKYLISLIGFSALLGATSVSAAEVSNPEEEIRYRQSVMNVMGRARAEIQAMVKSGNYDATVATRNVNLMLMLTPLSARGYGPGTEHGAPTKAELKIWKEPAKYKQAHDKMATEMNKLPAIAGNKDKMKEALGDLGKACKGCHDAFALSEFRN